MNSLRAGRGRHPAGFARRRYTAARRRDGAAAGVPSDGILPAAPRRL